MSNGRNLTFADSRSLNWAGYGIGAASGSVTAVNGAWVQPAVSCAKGSTYSSFWVGIDGFNSATVEQTGTLAYCSSGVAHYSAWYEAYPAASVTISSITVHAGDHFTASVTYSGGQFTTTINDVTTSQSFSISFTVASAVRSSAECIAERPSIGGSITKLANFGTVNFTGCTATIGGVTGNFGSFAGLQSIDMVGRSGKVIAQTSALSGGTSFSVTWKGTN